ncbi:MAG: ATP-binding protein [Burkholderiales bacterium]
MEIKKSSAVRAAEKERARLQEQTAAMNEALLLATLRQHALTRTAEKLNAQLHAEIAARIETEAALAEADRRKNEFLALLAHELRNPLAPIGNALQILRETGIDGATAQSALAMMQRQFGQAVRLVDDLLEVSRISQGKIVLQRKRTDLVPVLNQAVEAARVNSASRQQEIAVTLPPRPIYLSADPTRLAHIIGNLLNNASKFSAQGGRIGLSVERDDAEAVIRVRDTGIGIAADQMPRIFEMFMQVDGSIERAHGGMGVGLPLAKKLVELHGGTIEAHSGGLEQGAEFVVRLPISTSPPVDLEPVAVETTVAIPRRILVVDDNADAASSLATLLELRGHEVHTAGDGFAAVEAAARLQPDVILLDIGMPKLNGYEACRQIRQQQRGERPLVIAMTGWGHADDRRRAQEAGFDFHLVKPVDFAALEKLLAAAPP